MITKELGKKILLYVLGLVVVILIVLPLFIHTSQDKDNQQTLQRLDEISQRLSKIGLDIEDISIQIQSLEEQKDMLIKEQTKLNDEASSLFLNLVTPEMIEPIEELPAGGAQIGPVEETDWQPGQLTADGLSQQMPEIEGETSHERFKQLAYKYGLDPSLIWEYENKYNIREGLLLAVVIAETSGGHNGNYVDEGCYNLGNVNNNDRGTRTCFDTKEESLEQVAITLNNRYLGKVQTLGCLSNAGSCDAKFDTGYRYATSNGNRERNILNVLNLIYEPELGKIDPETFNIRRDFTQFQ